MKPVPNDFSVKTKGYRKFLVTKLCHKPGRRTAAVPCILSVLPEVAPDLCYGCKGTKYQVNRTSALRCAKHAGVPLLSGKVYYVCAKQGRFV